MLDLRGVLHEADIGSERHSLGIMRSKRGQIAVGQLDEAGPIARLRLCGKVSGCSGCHGDQGDHTPADA
jgi:cytochrome c553